MKRLGKSIIGFTCVTGFLIISHISEKHTYINNTSNSFKHKIITDGVESEIYIQESGNPKEIVFHFNFLEIVDSIIIEELHVNIRDANFENIKCYNGMSYTNPTFQTFAEIPISKRTIKPLDVDPYYTFDFIYSLPKNANVGFVDIKLVYLQGQKSYEIIESYKYRLETNYRIEPIDPHSDITYLLIIPSATILLILIIIGLVKYFRRRSLYKMI